MQAQLDERPSDAGVRERRMRAVVAEAAVAERLLDPALPSTTCQAILAEMQRCVSCDWGALLQVTGDDTNLNASAAIGNVPGPLQESHSTNPSDFALLLGWQPDGAAAQLCRLSPTTGLRGTARLGGRVIVALLAGSSQPLALAVVGWESPREPDSAELEAFEGVCRLAVPVLGYEKLIGDLRIADRTKSVFVATMSHELRTPLSAIVGYTDLLVRGDFGAVGEEQGEILRRAQSSAGILLELINATLDVSRFEVGDRGDADSDVDLLALVREQVVETGAAHRGQVVRLEHVSSEAGLVLYADALELRVAIRQVLEAAVAANPAAQLSVAVDGVSDGCAIEIRPAGAVPAPGDTPILIELPEDGDGPDAPFSVFVAKRLLEMLGGTLAGSHYPDDGVGFRMWLPRATPIDISPTGRRPR